MSDSESAAGAGAGVARRSWRSLSRAPSTPSQIETEEQLVVWISDWITRKLRLPPGSVTPDSAFSDLGLDSMVVVALSGRLEELLHRPVPPSAAWEHPTIAELARALFSAQAAPARDMDAWG